MPRLNKVQRGMREERRAAVAAQLAADAQTTGGHLSGLVDAPPPPSANALSTNQPLNVGGESNGAMGSSAVSTTTSSTFARNHSPSSASDSAIRSSSLNAAAANTPNLPPAIQGGQTTFGSGSRSPLGPASDMSTSEGSENEDEGKEKSVALDGGPDEADGGDDDDEGGAASAANGSNPEVKCMWEDCGQIFTSLAPFISHLHDDHVGIHKARYACEWTGCPRKGKSQTSRFALLSHLRSHTGEKPFTCPRPECDKSFTRSDALAKHMRVQHNINPVSSRGRGSKGGAGESVNNSGGRQSRAKGGDDDDDLMGEDSVDAVGDELLELAEGENNPSLAEIEQGIAYQGARSFAFTYENLFGSGARALANYGGASSFTDAELGIVRDRVLSGGLLLGDDVLDDETTKREEESMVSVLEAGRRSWVLRERERARLREVEEEMLGSPKRAADYDSDDMEDAAQAKRGRRSSTRADSDSLVSSNGVNTTRASARSVEQAIDGAKLKKLYMVEKAKLRIVQGEHEKLLQELTALRRMEKGEQLEKREMLEKALEAELGRDVAAIFSPPPSPPR